VAGGRTVWMPMDVAWMRRERHVRVGLKFGTEGVGVLWTIWLMCKEQRGAGRVKFGFVSLARDSFVMDPDRTETIVRYATEVGALSDLTVSGEIVECEVTDFAKDDARGSAAGRKADQRLRDSARPTVTTASDVTKGHPRGEESREETTSVESGGLDGPDAPHGRSASKPERWAAEISELFAYWQQQCGHPHAKLTSDRRAKVRARLNDGTTVEDIRRAIDGAAANAFVDANGVRHDDLELICRNGSKLTLFMARASKPRRRSGSAFTIEQKRRDAGMCTACGKREPADGSERCEGCGA
jgi:hypothetical protein